MGEEGERSTPWWSVLGLVVAIAAIAWLAPRATDASPIATDVSESVDVSGIPPILVLLHPAGGEQDPAWLEVAVAEADRLRSARGLVPLADDLDPEAMAPGIASTAWLARGRALERDGFVPEARHAYGKVAADHWAYPSAQLGLGRIQSQLGDQEGARVHLQAAIDAGGPTETAARLAMAQAFLADGKPDQAIWTWRKTAVRSATYDGLRVKTKRLKVRQHRATWVPVLADIDRLLAQPDPYQAAVVAPGQTHAIVRQRLLADPALIELEAERPTLEGLRPDPEHEDRIAAVSKAHREAAIAATRSMLETLAGEVRRSMP